VPLKRRISIRFGEGCFGSAFAPPALIESIAVFKSIKNQIYIFPIPS
jgi:hypothetical protein